MPVSKIKQKRSLHLKNSKAFFEEVFKTPDRDSFKSMRASKGSKAATARRQLSTLPWYYKGFKFSIP